MTSESKQEFSRWRSILWPVHNHELRKLLPMLAMFFLVSLDYNILRTLKDTILVTAKASGAEVIPFIKVWVMLPMTLLMTFLFTRLSNHHSREKVFYVMISIFLLFFLFFAWVLYPIRDLIHPHTLADKLQTQLPEGFKGLIAMIRYWSFTLFYVMAEMWSNIILTMLFWGFANEITRITEAKRFYGLFGIGANFSGIAAGQISILFSRNVYNPALPFGQDAWHQSLIVLVSIICFVGIVSLYLFRWIHLKVLTDAKYYNPKNTNDGSDVFKKTKMSLRENLRCLLKSKVLISILIIVLAYNGVINLVEVVWKHQVRELYPSPADYNIYMNKITTLIGCIATLTAFIGTGNSIRKMGWTFTALLTPLLLLVTSILFFGSFLMKDHLEGWGIAIPFIGAAPLAIVVFFGSLQNCISRAAKYTVFDATRELAFVPLASEEKLKGKALIDGIGSRLGKSGGAITHQALLLSFATITASAPFVAIILFAVIAIWTGATLTLGKQFNALTKQREEELSAQQNLESQENEEVENDLLQEQLLTT